jgi:WD40 repeat protein
MAQVMSPSSRNDTSEQGSIMREANTPSGASVPPYRREFARLAGHDLGVQTVLFSPDSALLASSGWDGTVRLWSVAQGGQPIAAVEGMRSREAASAMAFSPDGALLATSAEGGVLHLWTRTGALAARLESGCTDTAAVPFSPDGRYLAASFGSGEVVVWRVPGAAGAFAAPIARLADHEGSVTDIAFSPDGQLLISGDAGGTVRLWRTDSWRQVAAFAGIPRQPDQPSSSATRPSRWVGMFAWSPDSRRVALRGRGADGEVQVWDVPTGLGEAAGPRWAGAVTTSEYVPVDIRFSPDGRLLTVAEWTRKAPKRGSDAAWLYAAQSLAPVGALPTPDDSPIRLAFAPDGGSLAVGGAAGMVWLWDVRGAPRLLAAIAAHTESWDYRAGAPLFALESLAWSPDGQWLATAGLDPLPANRGRGRETAPDFTAKLWRLADILGTR